MSSLFGTDGVRGRADALLTPELVVSLARAIARTLLPEGGMALIGRDTRTSGPRIEAALVAGLTSSGVDVRRAGVIPTPAIAYLVDEEGADLGIVVSASHNPPEDNGIKLFGRRGAKLTEAVEQRIEAAVSLPSVRWAEVGTVRDVEAATARYQSFLRRVAEVDRVDLSGMRLVVDCAYGAASAVAPQVFRDLGAAVVPLHATHEGERINVGCGATHLEPVSEAVRRQGADLGIAFDGDGDRVLLVDGKGLVIDGDRMLGIAASWLAGQGLLSPRAIVATILSNQGLELWLAERDIVMIRTPVGDRNVFHRMVQEGVQIGGEASGHIIFRQDAPTGDGILTAIKLLGMARNQGVELTSLARQIPLFPQCARDIACSHPSVVAGMDGVQGIVREVEREIGARGRVVLRASGTQSVLRIMVEAEDAALCRDRAEHLAQRLQAFAQLSASSCPVPTEASSQG